MFRQRIKLCATSDGVRIAYARIGQGAPIIRTASWLSHLDHEPASPMWRHWLSTFSQEHTLYRYDPRGCGLSDREVDDLQFDAWIRDLEAVADDAGLEQFALMGSCQGGVIAAAYAARHPERVSCLIIQGGYVQGPYARTDMPARREEAEALEELIRLGWGRSVAAFRQVFSGLLIPGAELRHIHSMGELQRLSTNPDMAARCWDNFNRFDISDIAPQIKVPTLVLHARDDAMVPFEEGRRLASLIPGARFVPLEGQNHLLLEDEPAWRQFQIEALGFIREHLHPAGLDVLTRREREVLALVAEGLINDDIASKLHISQHTVRNHLASIFSKLNVSRRVQLMRRAWEAGLARPEA